MRLISRNSSHVDVDEESLKKQLSHHLVPSTTLQILEETNEIERGNERHLDILLTRYIRAEKWDLEKALRRLERHAQFRQARIPAGSISEDLIAGQIQQQKVFLQPCGKDGRPLLIIKVAKHLQINEIQEVENFVLYSLEAASRLCDDNIANPDGKLYALFDLNDIKWKNMDSHALRSCFHLLNSAFPERVLRIFMLDSHYLFDSLWRIVKPFIDPVSRAKVCFVSGKEGRRAILDEVDAAIVPKTYGGDAEEEISVETTVAKMLKLKVKDIDRSCTVKMNGIDTALDSGDTFYDCDEC